MNLPNSEMELKRRDDHSSLSAHRLNNIAIKAIEMENHNEQVSFKHKRLKHLPPNKIGYHSNAEPRNPNTKMLPGISIKNILPEDKNILELKHRFKGLPVRRPLRNSRNSQILNSIIDILKTDPDKAVSKARNATHTKTEPSYLNEFLEMRQISSVKNSRGPKVLGNDLMMFGSSKRNLQSQEKSRERKFGDFSYSLNKKPKNLKTDPFDEMEMTFYKPCPKLQPSIDRNQFMLE